MARLMDRRVARLSGRRGAGGRPFEGHVVAITGGARGIGLVTARALVEAGASVALGDLDAEFTEKAAAGLGSGSAAAPIGLPLDVSDPARFAAFYDEVERRLGPIDVLVNNAGIMPLGAFGEEQQAVTRRIIDVNLHGVIHGTKLAIARMTPRGHGQIVNVSSAVGRVALAGAATYSASKYAVIGLTEAVRSELRGTGVEVSCVVPMIVNTELGAGLRTLRGQRTVEAEEVAAAILASIARPRFERWVPASAHRLYLAMSLLPRSWSDGISRAMGAAGVLATPDRAARAAYEARVRS